jgi:hypothetical protein
MNRADFMNTKVGDKIVFNKSGPHWFTNRVENAKKFIKGQVYTVKEISVASSSTGVEVEEIDGMVELCWFNRHEN